MNDAKYYRIPEKHLEKLESEFARINKRARKNGLPEVSFKIIGGETQEFWYEGGPFNTGWRTRGWLFIEVHGETPTFEGWTFLAALDHSLITHTLIQSMPGTESIPEHYRNSGPNCDHCKFDRRRKTTYVVQHADGTTMQVGSTCIRDFLGSHHNDPVLVVKYLEELKKIFKVVADAEEDDWKGIKTPQICGVKNFLRASAAAIRVWGWTSRREVFEAQEAGNMGMHATAEDAAEMIYNTEFLNKLEQNDHDAYKKLMEGREKDWETAENAIKWIEEDIASKTRKNDYEHNVCALVEAGHVPPKGEGIAASIVAMYQRAQNQKAAKAAEAKDKNIVDSCFGAPKKREVWKAEIVGVRTIEGMYGPTTIVNMLIGVDGARHRAVWFASDHPCIDKIVDWGDGVRCPWFKKAEPGDTVWIRGTVKKHGKYRGQAQTTVNRCALTDYNPEDKAAKKALKKMPVDGLVDTPEADRIERYNRGFLAE